MTRTSFTRLAIVSCLLFLQGIGARRAAQDVPMNLRVNVVLVQLNVAVTDSKGNYVTGLHPEDFAITEDKIPQKVSTFEESKETGHGPKWKDLGMRRSCPRGSKRHRQNWQSPLLLPIRHRF